MRIAVWTVLIFSMLFASFCLKTRAYRSDLEPCVLDRPDYQVTYVQVPASSHYSIIPVVSDKLDYLNILVDKVKDVAVAGINAGYFDPNNKMTTSYVLAEGHLLANPVDNQRFVENPSLYPYITDILNRSEFRVMECGGKREFAIAKHRDPLKFRCKLLYSLQAGPNLYEHDALVKEAFVAYKGNQRIRDPLGVDGKNARSAIGIDANGGLILAMASMKPLKEQPSGVTLREMTSIMRELGAEKALSLDGGSSSSLWVGGQTYFGKLDKSFNPVKRQIKSALVVIREE
jgi:hypothetical protein